MSKKLVWIACIFLLVSLVSSASHQIPQIPQLETKPQLNTPKIDINYGKIPLYFIPNEGQVDEKALFYADTSKYTLWITQEGLIFDSLRNIAKTRQRDRNPDSPKLLRQDASPQTGDNSTRQFEQNEPRQFERDVSRVKFLNANPNTQVYPEGHSDYKVSYFRGKDRSGWQTGIGTSKAVLYKSL